MTLDEIIAGLRRKPEGGGRWTLVRLQDRDYTGPGLYMWIEERTAALLYRLKWTHDEYHQYVHTVHCRPVRDADVYNGDWLYTKSDHIVAPNVILDTDVGQPLEVNVGEVFDYSRVKPTFRRYGQIELTPADSGVLPLGRPSWQDRPQIGLMAINSLFQPAVQSIPLEALKRILLEECDKVFNPENIYPAEVIFRARPEYLEYRLMLSYSELLEKWRRKIGFKNDFFNYTGNPDHVILEYCSYIWKKLRGHLTELDGELFNEVQKLGELSADSKNIQEIAALARKIERTVNAGSYPCGKLSYVPRYSVLLDIKLFYGAPEQGKTRFFMYPEIDATCSNPFMRGTPDLIRQIMEADSEEELRPLLQAKL